MKNLATGDQEERAIIHYEKLVCGALVTRAEWLTLTADELRQALTNGDMIVIRQPGGEYLAADGGECHDHVSYGGDGYWRPSGRID
jgi:hypothetical protein